ncbi:MAG: DJ-1 family glyoxalase III [Opitutales bacterium]
MHLSVLLALHDGFEEVEAVTPLDLLRRAGLEVVAVACQDELTVRGRSGITLLADTSLAELPDQEWALLVVPGGPAVKQGLREHAGLRQLLQVQADHGGWIGAICAAPLVLHDAGLLAGKRFTAHPSALGELGDPAPGDVVRDGRLITSRGAGTAVPFSLALIEALCGAETARNVADSICWPNG